LLKTQLIVGLGNPGKEYAYTRHNLGFLVVSHLAKKLDWQWRSDRLTQGLIAKGELEGKEIYLLLPQTFMNNSGVSIKAFFQRKKLSLEDLLVICDDLNLSFGDMRLRSKGSAGGHKGLSSMIQYLQGQDFGRLRLGIGQPSRKEQTVDYVLQEFDKGEKKLLDELLDEATNCCLIWLREGINKAMQLCNRIERKEHGEGCVFKKI